MSEAPQDALRAADFTREEPSSEPQVARGHGDARRGPAPVPPAQPVPHGSGCTRRKPRLEARGRAERGRPAEVEEEGTHHPRRDRSARTRRCRLVGLQLLDGRPLPRGDRRRLRAGRHHPHLGEGVRLRQRVADRREHADQGRRSDREDRRQRLQGRPRIPRRRRSIPPGRRSPASARRSTRRKR